MGKYKNNPDLVPSNVDLATEHWTKFIDNKDSSTRSKDPITIKINKEELEQILVVQKKIMVEVSIDMFKNNLDDIHVGFFDYTDPSFRAVSDQLFDNAPKDIRKMLDELYVEKLYDLFKSCSVTTK